MKKKIISFGLIVSSILCVSGCRYSIPENKSEVEPTHISFSFWEPSVDNNLENGLNLVIENYNKIHPEVEIELIPKTVTSYQEWIKEEFSANHAPTIEANHTSEIQYQYNQGLIYDLTNELDNINEYDGTVWRDEFIERKLEQAINGVTLPWFDLGVAYYYNKTIYKELNLKPPETWTEFMNNCQVIEDYGKNPIAFMAQKRDALLWLSFYIETGISSGIMKNDKNINVDEKDLLQTNEIYDAVLNGNLDFEKGKYKKMLSKVLDTYQLYKKYAHNCTELDEAEAKEQFIKGDAVHIMSGCWDMNSFLKNKSDNVEIGTFRLPRFTEDYCEQPGDVPFIGGVQSVTITTSATQKQREAAVDFLKFLFSKEQYKLFFEETMQMPTMKCIEEKPEFKEFVARGNTQNLVFIGNEGTDKGINFLLEEAPDYDEYIKETQSDFMKRATDYYNLRKENGVEK